MAVFAVWVLLIAFVIALRGPSADPQVNEKRRRKRRRYLMVGIGLLAIATLYFGLSFSRRSAASWRLVTTDDGVASIEMPGAPSAQIKKTELPVGILEAHRLTLSIKDEDQFYSFSHSNIVGPNAGAPAEEQLQQIRDNLPSAVPLREGEHSEVMRDEKLEQNGLRGIELELQQGKYTTTIRVFIVNERIYTATVTVPTLAKDTALRRRFLDSFKILRTNGDLQN